VVEGIRFIYTTDERFLRRFTTGYAVLAMRIGFRIGTREHETAAGSQKARNWYFLTAKLLDVSVNGTFGAVE